MAETEGDTQMMRRIFPEPISESLRILVSLESRTGICDFMFPVRVWLRNCLQKCSVRASKDYRWWTWAQLSSILFQIVINHKEYWISMILPNRLLSTKWVVEYIGDNDIVLSCLCVLHELLVLSMENGMWTWAFDVRRSGRSGSVLCINKNTLMP